MGMGREGEGEGKGEGEGEGSVDRPPKVRHLAPVVVNTSGWVKGLGFELLQELVRSIRPARVVEICTRTKRDIDPEGPWAMATTALASIDQWEGGGGREEEGEKGEKGGKGDGLGPNAHAHATSPSTRSKISAADMRGLSWLVFGNRW